MGDADHVAASLQARLDAVTFTERNTDAVTKLLIDTAATWVEDLGWRVYRRAASITRLARPTSTCAPTSTWPVPAPDGSPLAIEIDCTKRQRTLDTLQAEAMAGRIAIWVRWSQRQLIPVPDPIRTVNITVISATACTRGS